MYIDKKNIEKFDIIEKIILSLYQYNNIDINLHSNRDDKQVDIEIIAQEDDYQKRDKKPIIK